LWDEATVRVQHVGRQFLSVLISTEK